MEAGAHWLSSQPSVTLAAKKFVEEWHKKNGPGPMKNVQKKVKVDGIEMEPTLGAVEAPSVKCGDGRTSQGSGNAASGPKSPKPRKRSLAGKPDGQLPLFPPKK